MSPELQDPEGSGIMAPLVTLENITDVAKVYIAVLNVKTTAALGETPVAPLVGTTDVIVTVCAFRQRLAASERPNAKMRPL